MIMVICYAKARKVVAGVAGAPAASTGKIDLPAFIRKLTASTDAARMSKVTKMLRADRFQLFTEVTDDHVTGALADAPAAADLPEPVGIWVPGEPRARSE